MDGGAKIISKRPVLQPGFVHAPSLTARQRVPKR